MKKLSFIIAGLSFYLTLQIPISQADTYLPDFNPNAICGDYLKQLDPNAPDYFEFVECKYQSGKQGKPYAIIYTFSGQHAKVAEQYLHEKYNVARFKFTCCYWESRYDSGQYVDPDTGYRYHFRAASEEGIFHDMSEAMFYLSIALRTEDI